MSSYSRKPNASLHPEGGLSANALPGAQGTSLPSSLPQPHPTPAATFEEWQPLYFAAMLEVDSTMLVEAISLAEVALFRQMKTLFFSAEHSAERSALERAWNALQERKENHQRRMADGSAHAA